MSDTIIEILDLPPNFPQDRPNTSSNLGEPPRDHPLEIWDLLKQIPVTVCYAWAHGRPLATAWIERSLISEPSSREKLLSAMYDSIKDAFDAPKLSGRLSSTTLDCLSDSETRDPAWKLAVHLSLINGEEALMEAVMDPGPLPPVSLFQRVSWTKTQQETVLRTLSSRLELGLETESTPEYYMDADGAVRRGTLETPHLLNIIRATWVANPKPVDPDMRALALDIAEQFFLNSKSPHRLSAIHMLMDRTSEACFAEAERLVFEKRHTHAMDLYVVLAKDRIRLDFAQFLHDSRMRKSASMAIKRMPNELLPLEWAAELGKVIEDEEYDAQEYDRLGESGRSDIVKRTRKINQLQGADKDALTILGRMGEVGLAVAQKYYDPLPRNFLREYRGLTLSGAAEDLVQLGLLAEKPQYRKDIDDRESGLALALLGAIRYNLDCESVDLPPPHDCEIAEMAKFSRGQFCPEHPRQYPIDPANEESPSVVEFGLSGKLIRFFPRQSPQSIDFYDGEALIHVANKALELSGKPGRFHAFVARTQVMGAIFGEPTAVKAFCEKYLIDLSRDA